MSSPETAPAVRMRNPDVIGTVMKEMNKHGLSMDLKKKNKYGGYDAADSSDMNVVKSQAKLANTAQALQLLDPEDRTAWAIGVKDKANELYQEKDFHAALDKYMDALAASCFDESEHNNVDSVVVPVLCNLAACSINLEEWGKALEFCNQAINLRPDNLRALSRRGAVQLHLAAFASAKNDLSRALKIAPEDEKPKLTALLKQAQNGVKKEAAAAERQRAALKKAFDETKVITDRVEPTKRYRFTGGSSSSSNTSLPTSPGSGKVVLYLQYMLRLILGILVGGFMLVYDKIRGRSPRINRDSKEQKEQ